MTSSETNEFSAITGRVRTDETIAVLVTRLEKGDIAVIDFPDLDRESAEALINTQPAAVLNAAISETGRHFVKGAALLVDAGIPVIDDLGSDLMVLREGERIDIVGPRVMRNGLTVATGRIYRNVASDFVEEQPQRIQTQLAAMATSASEYLAHEGRTIFDGQSVPRPNRSIRDRIVVLVNDSQDALAKLKKLKRWIRDTDPLLVGTDTGARVIAAAGLTPSVIVGNADLVSEKLLRSGAQLIARMGSDGTAPGSERLTRMGVAFSVLPYSGDASETAMIFLHRAEVASIVTVGIHHDVYDLVDRGLGQMNPAYFARLAVQDKLIPAQAVLATYRPRLGTGNVAFLFLAMLLAILAAFATTPFGQDSLAWIMQKVSELIGGASGDVQAATPWGWSLK